MIDRARRALLIGTVACVLMPELKLGPTYVAALMPELKLGPTYVGVRRPMHVGPSFSLGIATVGARELPQSAALANELPPTLTATAHPPLPGEDADVWLVPNGRPSAAVTALGRAASLIDDAKYTEAAAALSKATLDGTPLASYRQYYAGLLAFRAGRLDEAQAIFGALVDRSPRGYLIDAARSRAGEVAEQQGRFEDAAKYYEPLSAKESLTPDQGWIRLARVRQAAGDLRGAAEAYARVYYEFPLSDLATIAAGEIGTLNGWEPLDKGSTRYKMEFGRAQRLFGAARYAQARDAFDMLRPLAEGDEQEVAALRVAECDYYLKRYGSARDALDVWIDRARRRAEARFFHLGSTRELGEHAEYVRLANALVAEFPNDSWAEDTLNNLATHYILTDDDDQADATFRELASRFPDGRYAPRAHWKIGWNAYRKGRWAETADLFEHAAARYARSDYRPSWVYWAARSRDQLGDSAGANRLYGILVSDYLNSYYGRLASRTLTARNVEPMTMAAAVAPDRSAGTDAVAAVTRQTSDAAMERVVGQLIAAQLWDPALNELLWAQKNGNDTPAVRATLGYVYARQGDLRRGINAIKRAYPQYIAANEDELPAEVLQVLFPVAYWDLIRRHAPAQNLDPYLVAALMAQESTFDAGIVSHANAVGLMQIVPATGRSYARRLRMPRYSASRLTDPATNVKIGTAYFADLVERFGGIPYALASYNAGPGAVARWMAERPGIAADEFIDDIPYPETQNYVRKILGTAEDYRRIYGELGVKPLGGPPGIASSATTTVAPAKPVKPQRTSSSKKKTRTTHHRHRPR
jgi:peptidoglycan lytic transglycosylase